MQDITLPTWTDVAGIDQSSFIWDDIMDGLLAEHHGTVIKSVLERCPAGSTVEINEQYAGTGKTAKFILDNVTGASDLNIVTTDAFTDTFLTTSEFWDNVQNATNCYKNDNSDTTVINFDEGGNAINLQVVDPWNNNSVLLNVDLTGGPIVLGVNDLANYEGVLVPASHIVNHTGTPVASTQHYFTPDVAFYFPWPISNGFPAFEREGVKNQIARMINRAPDNGIIVLFSFHTPQVNETYWMVKEAMNLTGQQLEVSYVLNTEESVDGELPAGAWQAAILKKL